MTIREVSEWQQCPTSTSHFHFHFHTTHSQMKLCSIYDVISSGGGKATQTMLKRCCDVLIMVPLSIPLLRVLGLDPDGSTQADSDSPAVLYIFGCDILHNSSINSTSHFLSVSCTFLSLPVYFSSFFASNRSSLGCRISAVSSLPPSVAGLP